MQKPKGEKGLNWDLNPGPLTDEKDPKARILPLLVY